MDVMQDLEAAQQSRPAWVEVDLAALRANFAEIKRVAGDVPVAAVVKANAYGHGALPVAQELLAAGAARLAVATLAEALELRAAGINAPIMLLGLIASDEEARLAVKYSVITPVCSHQMAACLSAAAVEQGRQALVQLVADTGMGRIGFARTDADVVEAARIAALPGVVICGMFSHFATADEADKTYAHTQAANFADFAERLAAAGVSLPCKTLANSAGLMELATAHYDMVRAGIILYGYYPSADVDKSILALTPVLSLKARLTWVKDVPAGTAISYGRTHITAAPAKIATIPVGYADGWNRLQSNNGCVLVAGRRCPIVGRVCMDQFMVDVTGTNAKVGDEAVLIGRQGDELITADEVAARYGTISYEVTSALLPRLPRKYRNRNSTSSAVS